MHRAMNLKFNLFLYSQPAMYLKGLFQKRKILFWQWYGRQENEADILLSLCWNILLPTIFFLLCLDSFLFAAKNFVFSFSSWHQTILQICFEAGSTQTLSVISIVKPTRCTNVSNLFYLEQHSTCFRRSFRPSSGVQDCTYCNRHLSNRYCWLLGQEFKIVKTASTLAS